MVARLRIHLDRQVDGKNRGCSLDYVISDQDAKGVGEALDKVPNMVIPGEIIGQIVMALKYIGGDLKVTDTQIAKSWQGDKDAKTEREKDLENNPAKPPEKATGTKAAGEAPRQPETAAASQAGTASKPKTFPKGTRFYQDIKQPNHAYALLDDRDRPAKGDKEITEDEYRKIAG